MARRKRVAPTPEPSPVPPSTGPGRFTVERFLCNCTDATKELLLANWREGNQLVAKRVPIDALPAVLILASYAYDYGIELVDDYDALIERFLMYRSDCAHPDKFMASCITILYERGLSPDDESFEAINIPNLYEELFP